MTSSPYLRYLMRFCHKMILFTAQETWGQYRVTLLTIYRLIPFWSWLPPHVSLPITLSPPQLSKSPCYFLASPCYPYAPLLCCKHYRHIHQASAMALGLCSLGPRHSSLSQLLLSPENHPAPLKFESYLAGELKATWEWNSHDLERYL